MSRIFWLVKVTRPVQFTAAAFGTWVVVILSNGSHLFSTNKLAAGACMGFGCLGASVFHYGAANKMYARKLWDLVEVRNPAALIMTGLVAFAASVSIASVYLPWECIAVTLFNVVTIVMYARILSRRWVTKNVVIAIVCTTPILLGWWAGNRTHPVIPYAIGVVFFAYFAREIIKDIHDIQANQGLRITLPIWLGVKGAMRVAGCLIVISTACTALLFTVFPISFVVVSLVTFALYLFARVSYQLLTKSKPGSTYREITLGIYSLIVSVVALGFIQ